MTDVMADRPRGLGGVLHLSGVPLADHRFRVKHALFDRRTSLGSGARLRPA